jgi:predicted ATP-grasp superfamily ATP-dependent carboligase
VLIKPSVAAGARGITWCHSADEVRERWPGIVKEFGPSYLQDFVPPGGMQHKSDLLVDEAQRLLAGVVYGKTRMYPPDGGSSVLNYTADRPDIIDLSHRMLEHLGWTGFCDFDFIDDPRDGRTYLMEINPRFPESLRMGTSVGLDFAGMMLDLAFGRPVEAVLDYPKDRFMRFLPGDLLWYLRVDTERRRKTHPPFFKFRHQTAYQLMNRHDPGPLLGYLLENASMLLDGDFIKRRLRLGSRR